MGPELDLRPFALRNSERKPQVSIGLPVYNGERYLSEAINSVLSQTFRDFELIISDNCSSDATEMICRAFAAKDRRIRYFRNKENLGAARNFNRTFDLSSGEYFKWLAADDVMAPEFLARCGQALGEDATAVLAYPRIMIIDEVEQQSRESHLHYEQINLLSSFPHERLEALLFNAPPSNAAKYFVFGLMRSEALKKTPLIRSYVGSDVCLLVDLVLLGKFVEIPEPLLQLRWHPQSYTFNLHLRRHTTGIEGHEQLQWFDPSHRQEVILPHWRFLREHFLSIWRGHERIGNKLLMVMALSRAANRQREILAQELRAAATHAPNQTLLSIFRRAIYLSLAMAFHGVMVVTETVFGFMRRIVRLPRRRHL
jgi:glycosyltransferase involved in cell wall biosynthesis